MDFKHYESQIRTLIPLRKASDYEDLFNKILFGENNSDKFLIKMELNRLVQPCLRIIDLRDKVTDNISSYQYKQLEHHLTTSAISMLKNNIELYGEYTIGCYENVLAHVQKVKQQQQLSQTNVKKVSNLTTYTTESIKLNNHNKRADPRMFFVSPVTITLENGEQTKATTSNISVSGLKIKLSENIRCANHEIIEITFSGLAKTYKNEVILQQKISYKLVKQAEENNAFYFYLQIEVINRKFINFIQLFIRNNQHKYKMDVHYYFQLARENALKNSALMSMHTLPIYLDANSASPILFVLRNSANKDILTDWQCNESNQLTSLFSELRLARLLAFTKTKATTTLYTFTYIRNEIEYLLSATEEELNNDNLKQLFIEYGQSKLNWRCYHLTLQPYTYQSNQEYDITAILPKAFKQTTHLATLTELTTNELFEKNTEKQALNALNQFVHRSKKGDWVPVYDLFPDELRKEERYSYNSAIILTDGDHSFPGKVVDFSYSGLKIKLDKTAALTKRTIININFTALQKLSKQFPLEAIEYRVIASSPGNHYHLQVASRDSFIAIHKFFSLLVKNNPSHFVVIPLKTRKQPVTARLREAAESSLNQALFFITTESRKPKVSFSSITPTATSLKELFGFNCNPYQEHNHTAISNNNLLDRLLYTPLRNTLNEPVNFEQTIYVKKIKNNENKWLVNSYLDEDFSSEESKKQFIIEHKNRGRLQILHYRLTTIKTPNLEAIKSEIQVISRHAMHLTKRIEDELLSVSAMIEIIDRTDHVLNEHNTEIK